MDCCEVYADQFDRDSAVSQAQQYRIKGLRGSARVMRDALTDNRVRGRSVLEIGGGVGGLSIDLLEAGARSAVNVELSDSYREAALALALEAGVEDRLRLVAGDGADLVSTMDRFDVVVMNRVVCCYRDATRLMQVGAAAASGVLAVSFPTVHPLARFVVMADNWRRARHGSEFRTYVHPTSTLLAPLAESFEQVFRRRGAVWTVGIWERPVSAATGKSDAC